MKFVQPFMIRSFPLHQVLVVVNAGESTFQSNFDLSRLSSPPGEVRVTRTSSTEQNADLGVLPLPGELTLPYSAPSKSVTTFVMSRVRFTPSSNLLVNGDFESPGKEGWGLLYGSRNDGAINGEYVYMGDNSGYVDLTISELSLMQNVTAPATRTYFLSARLATSGSSTSFGVLINGNQGPEITVESYRGYQPHGLSFEASVGDIISVYLYGPSGDNNAQIDNVILH
jgi:hypothetical protein